MLIVGCQTCGEAKILAGSPDSDGVARVRWTCPRCGTGQVLQLEISSDARSCDLRSILGGLAMIENRNKKRKSELSAGEDFREALGSSPE
jgi:ribosomal protein S27AE